MLLQSFIRLAFWSLFLLVQFLQFGLNLLWRRGAEVALALPLQSPDDKSIILVLDVEPELLTHQILHQFLDLILVQLAVVVGWLVYVTRKVLKSFWQMGSKAMQLIVPVPSCRSIPQLYLKLKFSFLHSEQVCWLFSTFFLQSLHIL